MISNVHYCFIQYKHETKQQISPKIPKDASKRYCPSEIITVHLYVFNHNKTTVLYPPSFYHTVSCTMSDDFLLNNMKLKYSGVANEVMQGPDRPDILSQKFTYTFDHKIFLTDIIYMLFHVKHVAHLEQEKRIWQYLPWWFVSICILMTIWVSGWRYVFSQLSGRLKAKQKYFCVSICFNCI